MHRDPLRGPTVAVGTHDSFDPHVVGWQVGELILELVEIERSVDADPDAVDSMSSVTVEMTTVVGVHMSGNLAIRLGKHSALHGAIGRERWQLRVVARE